MVVLDGDEGVLRGEVGDEAFGIFDTFFVDLALLPQALELRLSSRLHHLRVL